VKNPYFGGAVLLLLGPVFLGGLAMIFIGSFFFRGEREVHLFTLEYLRNTSPAGIVRRLRKNVFLIVLLTSITSQSSACFSTGPTITWSRPASAGSSATRYESRVTAYQNGPIRGSPAWSATSAPAPMVRQIEDLRGAEAAGRGRGYYPRPIATPVHGLRPARDTCENAIARIVSRRQAGLKNRFLRMRTTVCPMTIC